MEVKLTEEEIEAKRAEIEAKQTDGRGVFAFAFDTEFGQLVGYIKDPIRYTKEQALNLLLKENSTEAGKMLLESGLIKSESDPVILQSLTDETGKLDEVYYSCVFAAIRRLKAYTNQIKKN